MNAEASRGRSASITAVSRLQALLALLLCNTCLAFEPQFMRVAPQQPYQLLATYLQVYVDSEHNKSLAQVREAYAQQQFAPLPEDTLNLGFKAETHWFHSQLKNISSTDQHLTLELQSSLIDELDIYLVNRSESRHSRFGDQRSETREPFESAINQHFILKARQTLDVYLRIKTTSTLKIPFAIANTDIMRDRLAFIKLTTGFSIGFILCLLVINLCLLVFNREIIFLVVAILSSTIIVNNLTLMGYGYDIWPGQLAWQQVSLYVLSSFGHCLQMLFIILYLHLRQYTPHLYQLGMMLFLLGWCQLLLPLWIDQVTAAKFIYGYLLILLSLVMYCGFIRWRQGYKPALTLVICYSLMLSFIALKSVLNFDAYSTIGGIALDRSTSSVYLLVLTIALISRNRFDRAGQQSMEQEVARTRIESQTKSELLAKMSHEIRTPMNGVLGMAELLKTTALDETQSRYLGVIHKSGLSLLQVINDILDYSKLSAGKMNIERISMAPRELLEDVEGILSLQAEKKGLDLVCSIEPGFPDLIDGDPNRLRQVLISLLSNALKFTERGGIYIHLCHLNTDAEQLYLTVRDTGIGLTPAQQASSSSPLARPMPAPAASTAALAWG